MATKNLTQHIAKNKGLSPKFLRSIFSYNKATGELRWKTRNDVGPQWNARFSGRLAGNRNDKREGKGTHLRVMINKQSYYVHVIAWIIIKGKYPTTSIEHEDDNGENNRWSNLREASHQQNTWNTKTRKHNKSGFKGVSPHEGGRWRADIRIDGKSRYLGLFNSPEEAHEAYKTASTKNFGAFARHK